MKKIKLCLTSNEQIQTNMYGIGHFQNRKNSDAEAKQACLCTLRGA